MTLEHDLLDCPGDGLIIGADNVTLRLNGFMIDSLILRRMFFLNCGVQGPKELFLW